MTTLSRTPRASCAGTIAEAILCSACESAARNSQVTDAETAEKMANVPVPGL